MKFEAQEERAKRALWLFAGHIANAQGIVRSDFKVSELNSRKAEVR